MRLLKRLGHDVVIVLATVWFFVDVLFLAIVRPIRDRIMRWWWMQKAREWICKLGPYPSLAVFLVPVILLEPVKPVAAVLFHRHHHMAATSLVIGGELAKLAIIDQIFDMTKP